jgi:hypothetical protein
MKGGVGQDAGGINVTAVVDVELGYSQERVSIASV